MSLLKTYRLFIDGHAPEPSINPSGAVVMGLGTSSGRALSSSANAKFISFYFENNATSGDSEGLYIRQYISGAGGGGDTLRAFATVQNVAAATVRGAHISLSFGTSGTVTGLGVALECTLHIPNSATQAGTLSPLKVAINSDGATSDPSGAALSYIQVVNQGNATGAADVDDDASLFSIFGHTAGAGNMIVASATEANYEYAIRVNIDGLGTKWIMLASAPG